MCNGSTESWSNIASFTTCNLPTNLSVSASSTSARFTWSAPAGSTFRLEYKLNSASRWTVLANASSGVTVSRLSTRSAYTWRLGYTCNGSTVYVNGGSFTPGVGANTTVQGSPSADLNAEEVNLVFNVYPNPTSGYVTLELNGFAAGAAEIRLLDVKGRIILSRKEVLKTGPQLIPMRLFNLINGYYIIQVVQNGKYYTTRVTKM